MFNVRTFILLAVAAVLALGAAVLAHRIVTSAKPAPSVALETIPIVVAVAEIPYLSRVKPTDVQVIQFPKSLMPAGIILPDGVPVPTLESKPGQAAPLRVEGDVISFYFYKAPEEVVGKIATQTVYPGELLVKQRVRDNLGGNPLAAVIPEGFRAIALRINEATGVAGFLLAGNKVDILQVKRFGDKLQSQLIEHEVEILAVDQQSSKENDKPVLVRTVTLLLPTREAEKVIRSSEEGGIYLMLRNQTEAGKPAAQPAGEIESGAKESDPIPVTLIKGVHAAVVNCTRSTCSP